jgi:hypothetical protein
MAETMETQNTNMATEESCRQMVDFLEELLTRQIERLRRYDLDGAMELAEEATGLANAISQQELLKRPEYADERFRIERLYKDLELIIASERQEVGDKLKQIRQCIRTLGAYGE